MTGGMLTFSEFLQDTAAKGEVANLVFEQRLFELVGVLDKVTRALKPAKIPHALVGGLAVLVHVEEADPAHSMMTRDVDLMIDRKNLHDFVRVAGEQGFRFCHSEGLDMLLFRETTSARNAVHLLFSGEKVKASQSLPNPEIAPEMKSILGVEVPVIPVPGLLRMKLGSYRLKDQVHVQVMDAAGLITPEVETVLPPELQARLQNVRGSE